jgi:hypothetical protein
VTTPLTVTTNETIGASIKFDLGVNGALAVSSTKTVTINGPLADPGNRQVFSGAGLVNLGAGSVVQFNLGWWTSGADATDDSAAFSQALTSVNNNGGGVLYLPAGNWLTTGNNVLNSGTTIEGQGNGSDSSAVTTVTLTPNSSVAAFTIAGGKRNITFRNLRIAATYNTSTVAIRAEAPSTDPPAGDLELNRVLINGFSIGLDVHSTSGSWQAEQILVDHSGFYGDTIGIRSNTINSSWLIRQTFFHMAAGGEGIVANEIGVLTLDQVAGGGPAIPSPYCVPATKLPDISVMAKSLLRLEGAHTSVTIRNSETEAVGYFLISNLQDDKAPILLENNFVQGRIQINATATISSIGNYFTSQEMIHLNASSVLVPLNDKTPTATPFTNECGDTVTGRSSFINDSTTAIVPFETNNARYNVFGRPVYMWEYSGIQFGASTPMLQIGSPVDYKVLLRLGTTSAGSNEVLSNYYDLSRSALNGFLEFTGSQNLPYRGFNFNGPLISSSAIVAGVAALTDAATIATDANLGNHFRVTLGGNRTLGNPSNPRDGQTGTWEIIQDGTGSRTLAFGTKFAFGTDVPSCVVSTTANKRDFMTAVYNATADKWFVTRCVRGY